MQGKQLRFGGVVFDEAGRVLLREPTNHYGGCAWTFAKGQPIAGESPEAAARREVLEETGIRARVIAPIPGEFEGSATRSAYYLMQFERLVAQPDRETSALRWALPNEAIALISQGSNTAAVERDRIVLQKAVALRSRLRSTNNAE